MLYWKTTTSIQHHTRRCRNSGIWRTTAKPPSFEAGLLVLWINTESVRNTHCLVPFGTAIRRCTASRRSRETRYEGPTKAIVTQRHRRNENWRKRLDLASHKSVTGSKTDDNVIEVARAARGKIHSTLPSVQTSSLNAK